MVPIPNPDSFKPAFAGYAERARSSFARQGAMALIGAQMVDVRPGYCAIAITPRPEITQQHGYVHAGIVGAIVDSAGGYAGYTLFPEDSSVLTVEFKLNLLALRGGHISGKGHIEIAGDPLLNGDAGARVALISA